MGEWDIDAFRPGLTVAGLWRRPGEPYSGGYERAYQAFVESECRDAFIGAMASRPIAWVTPPDTLVAAERKLVQLSCAVRLGIPVPRTIVTNSAERATEFAEQNGGGVVIKPVRYGLVATDPQPLVAWAREASPADLCALQGVPVMLQERVSARSHLRVVTVGRRTFVSKLEAHELDWRSNLANHEGFCAVTLEQQPGVVSQAHAIAASLGLGFSAQDWIVPEIGPPVFLEANPNGQWLFLEEAHRGAIGRAMIAHLLDLGRSAPPARSTDG